MAALSNYSANAVLNWLAGKAAMPAQLAPYLALFTAAPTDAGGGTEVTGGSYARVQVPGANWTVSGSSPSQVASNATTSFAQSSASWGTVIAWGLYDAVTAGNLIVWDYLGNNAWVPFSGTLASPSVLTAPAHGFANGDSVVVTAEFGGVLPATAGSWTGLLTVAGATTDTFTAGVNATGTGNGLVRKVVSQVVPGSTTVSLASGNLLVTLA